MKKIRFRSFYRRQNIKYHFENYFFSRCSIQIISFQQRSSADCLLKQFQFRHVSLLWRKIIFNCFWWTREKLMKIESLVWFLVTFSACLTTISDRLHSLRFSQAKNQFSETVLCRTVSKKFGGNLWSVVDTCDIAWQYFLGFHFKQLRGRKTIGLWNLSAWVWQLKLKIDIFVEFPRKKGSIWDTNWRSGVLDNTNLPLWY
jgi:hypothetical protein